MNKDRINGAIKKAKGSIKTTAGKALGDSKMAAEGKSQQAAGIMQNAFGKAKDLLKE
jgi:uncharacterized protein YjbJ (UPF0337 family)